MRRKSFVAMLMLGRRGVRVGRRREPRSVGLRAEQRHRLSRSDTADADLETFGDGAFVRRDGLPGRSIVRRRMEAPHRRLRRARRVLRTRGVRAEDRRPRADAWARTYGFPSEPRLDPELLEAARIEATQSPQAIVSDSSGNVVYRGRIDDRWTALRRQRAAPNERSLEAAISSGPRRRDSAESVDARRRLPLGTSMD
jgi:hypothetical protein